MRLVKARVRNYRCVRDTGWFDIQHTKTILVGPNEAGKTAVLEALQQINPPDGVRQFKPLRDYPRRLYNADIQSGRRDPNKIPVVSARFELEPDDLAELPDGFKDATYRYTRYLGNNDSHRIEGGPELVVFGDAVRKDLRRMASHVDKQTVESREEDEPTASSNLEAIIEDWQIDATEINGDHATALREWLDSIADDVDETNSREDNRHSRLLGYTRVPQQRARALKALAARVPVFVYFSNYFRVRPSLHLRNFAARVDQKLLEDERYDFGNRCLLKLLGFSARELADLGDAPEPDDDDPDAFERYRSQLDERSIKLNAASVRLTSDIRSVWNPDNTRAEADTVLVEADGQYLRVVVQDELDSKIDFDQRSEGFQWLVSFFVVFSAEAQDAYDHAVLLLDEPGLSLHGLKQREFRHTVSRLAQANQTLYTTHSPFLVGPDELDSVRVVEMTDREVGTKVHTSVTASDPAALLPLQEALGYDLAQSLFVQRRNLVLEGLTDYWYLEATAQLLREASVADLDERIALVPADGAGKVVYFATIFHANKLKVAALLDSDNAGENAAKQETLIGTLGNRKILRTGDVCPGSITKPEIEDLLRSTLISVAKSQLGWDITAKAATHPRRPILSIFKDEISGFSKYRLAKAYLAWTRDHTADDLTSSERDSWTALIDKIGAALR